MRSRWRRICSSGSRQRCQVSYIRPTSAPDSPIKAAASSSGLTVLQMCANFCLIGDRAQAIEDCGAVVAGAGQEEDARRLERREAADAGADRFDALLWVLRSLHQRE